MRKRSNGMLNSRRRVLRNSFYTEGTLGGGSSLRTPRGGSGISRSTSDAEKRRTMIAELPAEDMALFRDETDAPQRLSVGHIAGSRSGKTVVDNRRIGGHVQSLVRANHSLQKNRKRDMMGSIRSYDGNGSDRQNKKQMVVDRARYSERLSESGASESTKIDAVINRKDIVDVYSTGLSVKTELLFMSSMEMIMDAETSEFERYNEYVFAQTPDKKSSIFIRENAINDSLDGDSIVNLWYDAMAKIETKFELSTQQKDFIHCCFLSLLPLFYGDQFDANIVRLTKQFMIDAIFKKIFFEMPRRFGKTMGTSVVSALVLWIMNNIVVGVYSIVKSASDGLVESCLDFYELICGRDKSDFVFDWDKQKGRVRVYNAYGGLSTLWGYSAVSSVRI